MMCCCINFIRWSWRRRKHSRSSEISEEEENFEACKERGRRKAICEISREEREATLKRLERHLRRKRLIDYGIIPKTASEEHLIIENYNEKGISNGVRQSQDYCRLLDEI